MAANTAFVGKLPNVSCSTEWSAIKAWTRKTFTRERVAEIVLTISTLTILGLILSTLSRGIQNCTFTAPGYF